jgi:hypothetical protein
MPLLWDLKRCRADRAVVNLHHKQSHQPTFSQQCTAKITSSKLRQTLLDNGTGKHNAKLCINRTDTPGHRPIERERVSQLKNAEAHREVVDHSISNAGTPSRDKSCNDVDASDHPHEGTLSMVRARGHVLRLWYTTRLFTLTYLSLVACP